MYALPATDSEFFDIIPSFLATVMSPLFFPTSPPTFVRPEISPVFLQFSIVLFSSIPAIPPATSVLSDFSFKFETIAVFWQATILPVDIPAIPPAIFPSTLPLFVQLVIVVSLLFATIPAV